MDDLVDGLIRLMNGNYSQPVNLGNPDEYTVAVRWGDELVGVACYCTYFPAFSSSSTVRPLHETCVCVTFSVTGLRGVGKGDHRIQFHNTVPSIYEG